MNIVFLDAGTLPLPIDAPVWGTSWTARPATRVEEVVHALEGAAIAITNKVPIRRAVLERLPALRFICVAATGYDCVDVAACRARGITVSNVPSYSAPSVAEWVLAAIFALRRQSLANRRAARDAWPGSPHFCVHGAPVRDVAGATLGVIGRGAIGTAVAALAQAVGMRVRFAEHRGQRRVRDGYTTFDEVLATSDVVSLHCPLTETTRHLIGAPELARMKPDALLINSARGALVDSVAVAAALRAGRLAGAAFDVLPVEPPALDEPLLTLDHPNVWVTPHVSWASVGSMQRLAAGIDANLAAFHAGAPINIVS